MGHDNYSFVDRVRDQALGVPHSTMRSLTTSICAKCPHLPPTGLHQSMHDPSKPLDYKILVIRGLSARFFFCTVYQLLYSGCYSGDPSRAIQSYNLRGGKSLFPRYQRLTHCRQNLSRSSIIWVPFSLMKVRSMAHTRSITTFGFRR